MGTVPREFVEAAQFGGERGAFEAEDFGGLALVAAGAAQGLFEDVQFDASDGGLEIEPFIGEGGVARGPIVLGAGERTGGKWKSEGKRVIRSPLRAMACSRAFSSWRTFPGQE